MFRHKGGLRLIKTKTGKEGGATFKVTWAIVSFLCGFFKERKINIYTKRMLFTKDPVANIFLNNVNTRRKIVAL